MNQISLLNRSFIYLGSKVNETQRLIVDNLGVAIITPASMILSTQLNQKKSKEQKEKYKKEMEYQAFRSPISAVVGFLIAYFFIVPVGRKLHSLGMLGKLPNHMNSYLTLDVLKHNKLQDILKTLKLENIYNFTTLKIAALFHASQKILEKEAKNVPEEAQKLKELTTKNLRQFLTSNEFDLDRKNKLKSILNIEHQKPFDTYKQIQQLILSMIAAPFSVFALNAIFPSLVKKVAPSLDKSVRDFEKK